MSLIAPVGRGSLWASTLSSFGHKLFSPVNRHDNRPVEHNVQIERNEGVMRFDDSHIEAATATARRVLTKIRSTQPILPGCVLRATCPL